MTAFETLEHDVVVIGAGGAGLRAAIEASAVRCCAALVCKSQLDAGVSGQVVFDWARAAMTAFEHAEKLRPKGDDDAILRWNTCARLLNDHPGIAHRPDQESPSEGLSDSLPVL